jgi:Flp pilus assembly protein TadG
MNAGSSIRTRHLAARLVREESGQTIIMFAIMMIMFLAMTGFVVDIGRAMVANSQLKSGTIAAALAGANEMPNSDYVTVAQNYSSIDQYNSTTKTTTTGNNTQGNLPGVQTQATGYCSTFVKNTLNVSCVDMGSGSVNALVVTQTVTLPMTFIRVLGINSITFSSTRTAAWKGAARNPYNVAVIVDATGSMNAVDTGSDGCNNTTAFACALTGVQNLLEKLTPCSGGGTCGSQTIPLDEVALYAFPGLSNSQAVSDDVNCNAQIKPANVYHTSDGGFGESDSTVYYGFPGSSFSGNALTPNPPMYQLAGFSNAYKTSDTSSSLNGASTLVKAVGGGGTANCKYQSSGYYYQVYGGSGSWGGIQAVGGADTYYAGVIYQAQSDLYSQYSTRLTGGTQTSNVMIVLSDGNANLNGSGTDIGGLQTNPVYTRECTGGYNRWGQCQGWSEVQTGTSTKLTANSNGTGTYPSYNDACQQAVTAAQAATEGTWPTSESSSSPVKTTVYSVAFGAETSGCNEMPPCTTMKEMASSYLTEPNQQDADFYSDYLNTATGNNDTTCTSANNVTNIPDIFQDIAATLSASKLMVNPPGCTAANASSSNCN